MDSRFESKETPVDSLSQELFNESLPVPPLNTDLKRELTLDDILIKSECKSDENRKEFILNKFNEGIKDHATTYTILPGRGQRIEPNEFILAERNQNPELVPFKDKKIAASITWFGEETSIIKKVKINDVFYGSAANWVLNVPDGQYAKVSFGTNRPALLDSGTHVIRDPSFRVQEKSSFVNKGDYYINHNYIHILRVPAGQYAKARIGGKPYILMSRENNQPYVFSDPLFKLENVENNSTFGDLLTTYIKHGTNHILRVTSGKVAKVWNNSKAYLLEARSEPYIVNSAYFNLDTNPVQSLVDTTQNLIQHGSIKRIMPKTTEVAVCYDNGNLKIYEL